MNGSCPCSLMSLCACTCACLAPCGLARLLPARERESTPFSASACREGGPCWCAAAGRVSRAILLSHRQHHTHPPRSFSLFWHIESHRIASTLRAYCLLQAIRSCWARSRCRKGGPQRSAGEREEQPHVERDSAGSDTWTHTHTHTRCHRGTLALALALVRLAGHGAHRWPSPLPWSSH